MKSLAIGIAAVLIGTGAYAQEQKNSQSDYYSRYGGPTKPPKEENIPDTGRVHALPSISGIVDEVGAINRERKRIRDQAVVFGAYRYQFTGSTRFLMDLNRTMEPKARFAMGDPAWVSIHPASEVTDGYTYDTAVTPPGTPVLVFLPSVEENLVPVWQGRTRSAAAVRTVKPALSTAVVPAPAVAPSAIVVPSRVKVGVVTPIDAVGTRSNR